MTVRNIGAGNIEIADPEHVERYWRHTQLVLDAAVTGADAAALSRRISDDDGQNSAAG